MPCGLIAFAAADGPATTAKSPYVYAFNTFPMDLKELENGVNPETHWYYQSKKLPLFFYAERLLNSGHPLTIVDVGAGSGFFALELEKHYRASIAKVYLVDIGYSAEEIASTKGQKIEKVVAIPSVIENALVLLMDVLEHLPDDLAMLQSIKEACVGTNNYFFITVPAFQSLWSGHDVFLGHYRRYRIPMLRQVLEKAKFRHISNYYLYGSLFSPIWAVRRLSNLSKKEAASNMRPAHPVINRLLLGLTSVEMKFTTANKLFGVTCVGQGQI
ncbi:class I SAM-dependent methyltransferase [Hymenobacter rubidus]|uniref:class I SAM-dependent methyltransferase n=1 Tax=Hymenobacter rubidus TaxID=1441626 RepID=UPI00191E363E|nr:methyltransferase domain-containing protein [Hymenobacter rubidus]